MGKFVKKTGDQGFSGPDFAKISAAALRIFLVFFPVFQAQILRKYPRRSCGSFWSGLELRRPTFDRFRPNFPICSWTCVFFYSFSGFLLPGWLPGDPRPFPNERSLNSHILCGLNLLIGQDLTHFYLTQSLGMHLFKRPTISAQCVMKESKPEKREGSFASVLVTESIDPLTIDHFPSFRWWPFHH